MSIARGVSVFLSLCGFAKGSSPPLSVVDPAESLGFPSVERSGNAVPTSLWGGAALESPLPTNPWWGNFVIGEGDDDVNVVFAHPYVVKATPSGMSVTYPWTMYVNGIFEAAYDGVVEPITLGAIVSSSASSPSRTLPLSSPSAVNASSGEEEEGEEGEAGFAVTSFSDLGVELSWNGLGMQVPLVQGSPFVSAIYGSSSSSSSSTSSSDVTPQVVSMQSTFDWSVDGEAVTCGPENAAAAAAGAGAEQGMTSTSSSSSSTVYTGRVFEASFLQSDARWAFFAASDDENGDDSSGGGGGLVAFDCSNTYSADSDGGGTGGFDLRLPFGFAGVLRAALVSNCTSGTNPHGFCATTGVPDDHSDYRDALVSASGAVPVGGDVAYSVFSPSSSSSSSAVAKAATAASQENIGGSSSSSEDDDGSGDVVELTFSWRVRNVSDASSSSSSSSPSPLAALTLPHHTLASSSSSMSPSAMLLGHRTVKGWMDLVTVSPTTYSDSSMSPSSSSSTLSSSSSSSAYLWTLQLDKPSVGFAAPNPIADDTFRTAIMEALTNGTSPDMLYEPTRNYQVGITQQIDHTT
jgi:hypothetical protein